MKRCAAVVLALALSAGAAWRLVRPPAASDGAPTVELAPAPAVEFARALEPRAFELPADHGPHFEFQTEWWYYTGQLEAGGGRRFGFQLTFFRRGLSPGAPPADSGLHTNQIYFAHLAVTDVAAGRQRFFERFARGAGGLAGARGAPYRVWLEDWRAEGLSPGGGRLHLVAAAEGLSFDLELTAAKPLVAHGERGLSPKSDAPGNASYYVGYTRLAARGRLTLDGRAYDVSGQAWFDHEWSTSALGPGAQGWDWFSLQLDDGHELMFFRIRREDGGFERVSGGTWVRPDGTTRRLALDDVHIDALREWTSPETRAVYPVRWRVRSAPLGLDLEVEALVDAQELHASFTYWEGAVALTGTRDGAPLAGRGFVELTGYAASLRGVF